MNTLNDTKHINLLYVEDNETTRELTLGILEHFFENITVAVDGQDGLEKFKSNNINFVITDIFMPNMTGIEMIREIRKIDESVYIVAITANSDNDSFMNTFELGVQGYIIKPLKMEQFNRIIKSAIEHINSIAQVKILDQYKDITDKSSIISKTNPKGIITYVNDKFCEISGYTKDELVGKPHNIVRHPDMPSDAFKQMWETIKNKQIWNGQVKNLRKDGTAYYVDATISPIINDGKIIEYIAMRNDITALINPKQQLLDSLKIMEKPLLVMIKVEQYDILTNLYSTDIINKFEDKFSNILLKYLPSSCQFKKSYKLGDGIFALLKDNSKKNITATEVEAQLNKFRLNVREDTFFVDNYEFDISVIISFVTSKDDTFENARNGIDIAMKDDENIIFANDLNKKFKLQAQKNTQTIHMIQKAIQNNNIVSYFQPIVNNDTMEIEKYESLVRLINDEGKLLSPYFFLDVAKESGHYRKITQIVLKNSFDMLRKTNKEISINLSALDIENVYLRNEIINLVTQYMDQAHRIVFELLEDEQVKDFEVVKDFISLLKTFGVQIAIDDFGAGVSNFERLLDYQPDILKIDACLIKNIDKDKYSRDVVETIQLFAWKQKIKTVAEFVETPEILQVVKDIGITHTQGYLLGKPQAVEDL
jgi:PAS domain S-box-containing protein